MVLPSNIVQPISHSLCSISAVGITIDSIQKEGIACFELAAAFTELQRLEGNFILVISTECN